MVSIRLTSLACTSLFSVVAAIKQEECGIWFAKSSIPNTGIGMYAGRVFEKDEEMEGDMNIPIVDIEEHHPGDWEFLWYSYYWNCETLDMEYEARDLSVASPGFGSAANSWLDLKNVEEYTPRHSLAGLHRSRDPGAGAISPFYNRTSMTIERIEAGQELFVSYGDDWFFTREEELGPIPVTGDLPKADKLLKSFDKLRSRHSGTREAAAMKDLWETFVWNSTFADTSRQFFALPKNWEETEQVLEKGLVKLRQEQTTQSLEWLQEHGICGDNIRAGLSPIPQAGRGAFATRRLVKDTIVAPLPLIHIPYRKYMEMYEWDSDTNQTKLYGHQLILNYCLGHRDSTLLLCPYGLLTGLINHGNAENANVKLRWSDTKRSCHKPDWLNLTVDELDKEEFAGLALEMVAVRDIKEGEEVLVDYGKDWEEAWKKHVDSWEPTPRAHDYVSADELNSDMDAILKTEFEQIEDPYEDNVMLKFDMSFRLKFQWRRHLEKGTLTQFKRHKSGALEDCEILRWTRAEDGRIMYSGVYVIDGDDGDKPVNKKFEDMPREAFVFMDLPYTADYHLPNVFRHDMRIPDDIFPERWKNLLEKQTKDGSSDEL